MALHRNGPKTAVKSHLSQVYMVIRAILEKIWKVSGLPIIKSPRKTWAFYITISFKLKKCVYFISVN